MSKCIYEYSTNWDDIPFKNKYTVVYENKTYCYCKVNGDDTLKIIDKTCIGDDKQYSFVDKKIDIEQATKTKELHKLNKAINQCKNSIDFYHNQIIIEESKLQHYTDKLKKMKGE
jgi:hypothetical protein